MRIERLETIPYALAFREPYVTARGKLERRELALVRIFAGGQVGLGEAAPLALRGGVGLDRIVEDLDQRCRPLLEGASLDNDLLEPCARAGASPQALLAMELAMLDLLGKRDGVPAWKRLGADGVTPVVCNATLSAGPPDHVAEQAADWAKRGFETFKLKLGGDDDIEQVQAVRDALGADARLRIDVNEAWAAEEAVEKLGVLEQFDIELAEQPVRGLAQLASLRRAVRVRIAADESVVTPDDAREAESMDACDFATVKLAKVGSIRAAFAIAEQLPVYLSSALDGPVGIAAAAHLAQALPDAGLAHGLATGELFVSTIASTECPVVDARLTPTDAPGFGVEIDEAAQAGARFD